MSDTRDSSLGGSSLVRGAQGGSFDLHIESDVIALLKLVHQNTIDLDIKNHLRDLIFAFRQSMDAGDLEKVRQGFLPLNITIQTGLSPIEEKVSTENLKPKISGTSRPAPRFGSAVASSPIKTEPQSQSLGKIDVLNETKVVMPTAWPEPSKETAEVVTSVPVTPPIQPVVQESVPVATTAPVTAVSEPVVYRDYSERIKEIKRIVNEKVGNPVNLIDSHNDIGREYMNALLDAMKKTVGGGQGGTAEAMARLERAFEQVRKVVINGEGVESSVISTPVVEKPADVQPAISEEVKTPISMPAEEMSVPVVESEPITPVEHVVPEVITKAQISVPHYDEMPVREPEPAITPTPQSPAPMRVSVKAALGQQGQVAPTAPASSSTAIPTIEEGLHSVAKDKQLQDLLRANRQKEAETFEQQENARIAGMDPLLAPDVTSGLSQLLSEWSLFKSSGIFGTGPSGKDHPLYLKIAPLTMAAVIAGRFDGATTPIKQSITDYMNGWRYEEGITHEHGETFEHYLRRVVRHILGKQKRS